MKQTGNQESKIEDTKQPLRVLIVEDSEDDTRMNVRELQRAGYTVTHSRVETAETMAAALERQPWDVIIADYKMPRFTAPAALNVLKKLGLDIPFIVVSGTVEEDTAVEVMKAGAHDFFSKERLQRLGAAVAREIREAGVRRQHREAEGVLRNSEARYHALFETSVDGILIADLETKAFKHANPAMSRMLGYTVQELTTMGISDIHPKNALPRVAAEFEAQARGEKTLAVDIPCIRKDGTILYADVNAAAVVIDRRQCMVGFFRDTTERKRAETALRESEEGYRYLFENMLNGFAYCRMLFEDDRPQDFIYLAVNGAFETLTGLKNVVGKRVSEVIPGIREADPQLFEIYGRVALTGVPEKFEVYVEAMRMWFAISVYSFTKEHFAAVFDVITERKLAEEQQRKSNQELQEAITRLREMQEQMIRQERLSALGQMAIGIAHDFNNALMPIMGNADHLLKNATTLDLREDLKQGLKDILSGAEDARSIVYRLHEFYRPQDNTINLHMNMNEVIRTAVNLTRPLWLEEMSAKGVTITVAIETGTTPIMANGYEPEFREALINLILNAVDAMPHGGRLALRCRQEETTTVVEVADTGIGMSDEIKRRCFEPFFSTKGKHGTGLGLAMVYGTVRRHNGTITVDSEVGKGATFRITLPLYLRSAVEQTEPVQPAMAQLPPLRVLLIDDNPTALKTMRQCLARDGHTVETAGTGIEGLGKFRAGRFDVVITDRALPGMSGDEVAKTVKDICANMPVVLLTGFGAMMNACGEKPPFVDVVLGKPAMWEEIAEALRKALEAGKTSSRL